MASPVVVTGSLNCPSCGAPAPADAVRCEYCGASLKTVACPSCFAMMFAGSQFCPHCGAKATTVEDDAGEPLPCPNCRQPMKPVRIGKTPMRQCASCGGWWLTTDAFTALCTDQEARAAVSSSPGFDAAPRTTTPVRLGEIRYRRCAACKNLMNRVNFGRVSGVVIDLCKGHGVWFDDGELQRALAFVANGGLERMRESEAEFRELSRKAWSTPDFALGDPQAPRIDASASLTKLAIHITSNADNADITRRMLQLLLT